MPEEYPLDKTYDRAKLKRGTYNIEELRTAVIEKVTQCRDSEEPISWSPFDLLKHDGKPVPLNSFVEEDEQLTRFTRLMWTILAGTLEASFPAVFAEGLRFAIQLSSRNILHLKHVPPKGYSALNDFKIHLCPKPEYIFWTVVRMLHFTNTHMGQAYNPLHWKFSFNARISNIRPEDTDAIRANGGNFPPIVIYGMTDMALNRTMLKQIIEYFLPVTRTIGNLIQPIKLPAGNLLYNALVAYASGDRYTKLAILEDLEAGRITAVPEAYGPSEWVQNACATNDWVTIYRFFRDLDYCVPTVKRLPGGRSITIPAKKDWSEIKRYPLPNPRTLMSEPTDFRFRRMLPRTVRNYVRRSVPRVASLFFGDRDPVRENMNVADYRAQFAQQQERENNARRRAKIRREDEAAVAARAAAAAVAGATVATAGASTGASRRTRRRRRN